MLNKVFYVVIDPKASNGLDIVELMEMMEKADCREIIKPGSKEECEQFTSQYTSENPYIKPLLAQQAQINEARKKAGVEKPEPKREYPLRTNEVLTDAEKMDILNKAFQDAAFLLHAALIYTGEARTVDANVTVSSGEKYLLTIQRVQQ